MIMLSGTFEVNPYPAMDLQVLSPDIRILLITSEEAALHYYRHKSPVMNECS
jgi:hypothetical protein